MNSSPLPLSDNHPCLDLLQELIRLRNSTVDEAQEWLASRCYFPGREFSKSAVNLSQYIMFRRRDLRNLQQELAEAGLSSLGRAETHLLSNLDKVISLLSSACRQTIPLLPDTSAPGFGEGYEILENNTNGIFGLRSGQRMARIIVTLPSHAATDFVLVKDLIRNGMDCARINTAHDNREAWAAMVDNIRQASTILKRDCRILMDLGGFKIRTRPIRVQQEVHHLKVKRDYYGNIVSGERILIVPNHNQESDITSQRSDDFVLPAPVDIYRRMNIGDRLAFKDNRGKQREIEIIENTLEGHWVGTIKRSTYLSGNSSFAWYTNGDLSSRPQAEFVVRIPPRNNYKITVRKGDLLRLSASDSFGHEAERDEQGAVIKPACLAMTMPEVLSYTKVNDSVWIDDGKVGGRIIRKTDTGVLLEITHAGPKGAKIGVDKGINFPDSDLDLPPLSDKDLEDLDFVCHHADMVGFSFVQDIEDIKTLYAELDKRGARDMPVIAKIETRRAVQNLPDILLASQSSHPLGIMIARGDLAVELGSVRLAEIQEEILWLCEAAHVPVIWATQVLESITKNGTRSRAEFTDAAMSVRAEGVMLNKGEYVLDAVRSLGATLERMQAHQQKKISRLRALHW